MPKNSFKNDQNNNERNKENRENKPTSKLSQIISSGIMSLPSDALVGEVRIEMRGRNILFINGCRRILKYSPDEIILSLKNGCIDVRGKCLICTTYHYGSVTVEGCICAICFEGESV